MTRICPFCSQTISNSNINCTNSQCGRLISEDDWKFKDVLRSDNYEYNYHSKLNIVYEHQYQNISFTDANSSIILIKEDLSWTTPSYKGCDDKYIAVFHKKTDDTWWLFSLCDSVRINSSYSRNAQLHSGDVVGFSNCKCIFQNEALVFNQLETENGVAVAVKDLCAKLPQSDKLILKNLTFPVNSGEFVGVIGPSGCGKSSLIQRIIGLADYYSGSIAVGDYNCHDDIRKIRKVSSYLPQSVEEILHSDLTVSQEFASYAKVHSIPKEKYEEPILDREIYEPLGLKQRKDTLIKNLSGGEKRRVAFGLMLLREPKLILLDEPTAGLDFATENSIMNLLKTFSCQGKTIICSTHVLENIRLFDKIIALRSGGTLAYYGTPKELLSTLEVGSYVALYEKLQSQLLEPPKNIDEDNPPPISLFQEAKINLDNCLSFIKSLFSNYKNLYYLLKSFFLSLCGYLQRFFIDSGLQNAFRLKKCGSKPLLIYFLQPLFVSAAIATACSYKYYDDHQFEIIPFCCCLAMLWLGMMNSARKLVDERIPKRCVERLNCVSSRPYLFAAIAEVIINSVLQSLSFTILFFILSNEALIAPQSDTVPGLDEFLLLKDQSSFFIMWMTLGVVSFVGGIIGLAISAVCRKTLIAVLVATLFTISALFFSKPVVNWRDTYNDTDLMMSARISQYMPCHYAYNYLNYNLMKKFYGLDGNRRIYRGRYWDYQKEYDEIALNKYEENPNAYKRKPKDFTSETYYNFKNIAFIWFFLSVIVMFYFQSKREKEWNGR